ncbi:MAG: 5'-nucleotidase C-terminal domain-containing protein, partial [Candidatus Poribacteria bacterium]|nr:5'-nucleotidase C-terminal domain-containing protein [Candidatus Poribacteria bacterium]
LLTLTASELLEVIEHSVAASDAGSTPGRFPQVAGLAFSYDTSLLEGSRVRSLVITDSNGSVKDIVAQNGAVVGDSARTFKIVTLNFLAGGGDDYPFANYPNANPVELTEMMTEDQSGGKAIFAAPGTEQDALAEYLAANFSETPFSIADVGPESDKRIQNLAFRADSLAIPTTSKSIFDVQLTSGLNMISLPLMPDESYTARSFMEKTGSTMIIKLDSSLNGFIGFTANSFGDGFSIEGGKGYIVNVTESQTAHFTGSAWQNTAAAPAQTSIANAWAFIFNTQFDVESLKLTVHNPRTGISQTIDANNTHAVWADTNLKPVISVGDVLMIEVRDEGGKLIRTLHHQINAEDIHRAFTELHLTPNLLKPSKTVLFNNYPNPFNPETWIPYQLVNDSDVTVNIYDASGHLVRHLDLGFQTTGFYIGKSRAAYWDGRNDSGERLASGVYFYQLITSDLTQTRKMVIMK